MRRLIKGLEEGRQKEVKRLIQIIMEELNN